jgi:predicted ATPase/class 3 adenylate cyclase
MPSGTVTFLFTDLEGSTRLWDERPDVMRLALARHDELVRAAVAAGDGVVVKGTGDGVHAAFSTAADAVAASIAAQEAIAAEPWNVAAPLRVRMGLHTGEAETRDGDYFGSTLNRAARLMALAHGGQIVCSQSTADIARDALQGGVTLLDLGEHRLRDLARAERVFQVCAPGLVQEFPPLQAGAPLAGNLPRQVTTFVGRDDEVADIAAMVTALALVTLTGVGGVGKTRLALEVAAVAAVDFPDGAWLCELAAVTDPHAVWDALAATFRIVPPPARRLEDVLVENLERKRALIVLDNCEHLLEGVAAMVLTLGAECRGLAILATSREGLALPGERIVAVPSLALPPAGASDVVIGASDAVRLFCDRARSAKHDFVADAGTLAAVGQLCRRLDGIPLAIELAAARIGSLSAQDLLDRLDERFRLLTRGSRASLARHQTLRSTIDWSYDLLTGSEREALQRLAVFAGGGDLAALEAVLSADGGLDRFDVVDVVSLLVDKSLVVAEVDAAGHQRYRMLETIRQYAQEQLEAGGDGETARRAHADYYVAFAEAAAPGLRGRELPVWAPRVEREIDNFRAVVDWAVDHERADLALRLVPPLMGHGHAAGYSATEWADTAIDIPGAEQLPQFLPTASWAVFGAAMRHAFDRATDIAARMEQVGGSDGFSDPAAYWGLGTLAFMQADLPGTARISEAWVAAAREAGDAYQLAHALVLHSASEQMTAVPTARAHMEEAARIAREAGALSALSLALSALVGMFDLDVEGERALALTEEAIAVASDVGDHVSMIVAGSTRAALLAFGGEPERALVFVLAAADELLRSNSGVAVVPVAWAAAGTMTGLGDFPRAAVLFGKVQEEVVATPGLWMQRHAAELGATLRAELGDGFQAAYDRGAAMTTIEVATFVSELGAPQCE